MKAVLSAYHRLPPVVRICAPIAWAGLIWMLSAMPGGTERGTFLMSFAFNGGHAVLYAVLGALTQFAWSPTLPDGLAAVLGFAFPALYGVVDELHQSFVPRRHASVLDVMTDACGALFAVALLRAIATGRRRALLVALVAAVAAVLVSLSETLS